MLRNLRRIYCNKKTFRPVCIQKHTFLTNDYKCSDAWSEQISSPILDKVKLNDFYNTLDQSYSSKGVISAIDVDIFANAIKDATYLEELRDLVHKLRLSAETGNMLESTNHAVVRNYIQYERIPDLIDILKDPLNYGVFLDDYTANILLDKLLTSSNYEQAANVASLIMLQEEYTNEITNSLCQFAALKYIMGYTKPENIVTEEKNQKVEEKKIRVKFVRNPYFDDHFDLKDLYLLSGKTLAWISERNSTNNLNNNLQLIGWLIYKKYDKLKSQCEIFSKNSSLKVYPDLIELFKRECNGVEEEFKNSINECITLLSKVPAVEGSLEESLKTAIENAINKVQSKDISSQQKVSTVYIFL